MHTIKITCDYCDKFFFRSLSRVNEARKFNWKQYCSSKCQYEAKISSISQKCGNPNCNKNVTRRLNQFKKSKSEKIFCSIVCSALFNNDKRKLFHQCPICNKKNYGGRKYCPECFNLRTNPKKIPNEIYKKTLIKRFNNFYKLNGRIPFKREMYGMYGAARKLFGSWNNAILAAGLKPNPVLFSEKHIAKDGHLCDSLSEKLIDDWLFKNNIKHKRNFPYPNSKFTADFEINGNFLEFFGLNGEIKKYDKNIKLKEKIAKKNNINLIKIYPKDLFPKFKLSEIKNLFNFL